ncbi:hypothetical protein ACPB67_07600 [Micromonospora taraxaci]|uniref:hypothetical protein n=1 Tax=Micromonospora taraxaci TaxID=1316803 RepID=UPI003C2BE05C
MGKDDGVTLGSLLVLEYERLKEEQKVRIGFRDNLLYVTLAAMAAIIGATLQTRGHANLLLLLPPAAVALGWTYLVNDEKISAIGRYVRHHLAPSLAEMAVGDAKLIFAWETAHRRDRRRQSRKYIQLMADLMVFCFSPLTAITVYFSLGPWRIPFVAVALAEIVLVIVLAAQIVTYADLGRDGSGTAEDGEGSSGSSDRLRSP